MSLSNEAIRLKKLRDYLDYSQRDLADEFQVTCGAIAQWESGKRPVPGPIVKLLEIYEANIQTLSKSQTYISSESVDHSRELLSTIIQSLKTEGITVSSENISSISSLVKNYFSDVGHSDPVSEKLKVAIARQIIKSFDGSRGLAIKVAQIAVFVDGGFPPEVPVLLGELLSNVKPVPFSNIQKILSDAYEGDFSKYFTKVNKEPFRVTSIAQLHLATTLAGENVVLKIRHPKIDELLSKQFRTLSILSTLKKIFGSSLDEVLQDIQDQVMLELDYKREAHFQNLFRKYFEHEPRILIPRVHDNLCRENILVTQLEPGLSFDSFKTRSSASERNQAAQLISYFHSFSIFEKHLMHSDPHPGNFLFRPNQVIFLDFGRIIEMAPEVIRKEAKLFVAILTGNKETVMEHFKKSGMIKTPDNFDYDGFWEFILEQQFHQLKNTETKVTPEKIRSIDLKRKAFKDKNKLILNKNLLRSSIVNVSLINLFAALEANCNWRKQAFEILKIDPRFL